MKNKGFTLIELMVVVVILGILAVAVAPRIPDLVKKAQEGATKGALATMRSTLNIYYGDVEGFYPIMGTGDITAAMEGVLIPKYIKKTPVIKVPTAHPGANLTNYEGYAALDTAGTLSVNNDGTSAWGYCGNPTATSYGNIIVNCAHTDTKAENWYKY